LLIERGHPEYPADRQVQAASDDPYRVFRQITIFFLDSLEHRDKRGRFFFMRSQYGFDPAVAYSIFFAITHIYFLVLLRGDHLHRISIYFNLREHIVFRYSIRPVDGVPNFSGID